MTILADDTTERADRDALIEALASFACEGILLPDDELRMMLALDAKPMSDDDKVAHLAIALKVPVLVPQ